MSIIKNLIGGSVEAPEPKKPADLEEQARQRASTFNQRTQQNSDRRQTTSGLRL